MREYKFTRNDRTGNPHECGYMKYDSTSDESATLCFYGDICGSTWESEWYDEDKAPQDIVDFLNELNADSNKCKKLDVYVNSGGGDVFGGIAIYNILSRYKGETVAHIDGIAASIAGIIPFACDKVVAKSSAQIMLHKPWCNCAGNADDLKKTIEALNACEESIIDIYAENAVNGTTKEKIKSMIDRETWLTCKEASQYFAIELESGEPVAACISENYGKYKNLPENLRPKKTEAEPELKSDAKSESESESHADNRKRKLQLALAKDYLSMWLF